MNIYQLSGLDERERGFTRQVECTYEKEEYRALLRYERVLVKEHSATNESSAIHNVITTLQKKGYTQLRSQLIFRGETYLGSQELWVDYPDPESVDVQKPSILTQLRQWLKRKKPSKSESNSLGPC
ncbi:hypothetical protein [Nitrospira sp. M1]